MIAPAELAARHTTLTQAAFGHLQRLMGSWGVLSDISFSDMLLLVPLREPTDGRLIVLGQIRPTTGATLIRVDMVGHLLDPADWSGAQEALASGKPAGGAIFLAKVLPPAPPPPRSQARPAGGGSTVIAASGGSTRSRIGGTASHGLAPGGSARSGIAPAHPGREFTTTGEVPAIEERAQLECLPVPHDGSVVAVLARVGPLAERRKGRLERVYRDLYQRLAAMVASGGFPHAGEELVSEDAPRVGDGLVVTDALGRVTYSSPNAMSALHRMGVSEAVEGRRLSEVGIEDAAIDAALASGRPVIEEVERRPDVIVLVHCRPLIANNAVTGSMVLLRDVTDLRRLDRLLLSKDAAIREVHHRVKNNLQTISSLLRLQARRLEAGKGSEALREAERRVRSISLVHEILSREPGDQVSFGEIVEALVRSAEDYVIAGPRVHITVSGDAGDVPADMATPLAVALAELLQNAMEHAFTDTDPGTDTGTGTVHDRLHGEDRSHAARARSNVSLFLRNDGALLTLQVRDDGVGLPPDFAIDRTTGLGLSIVRDLVRSQLSGTISMHSENGTVVTIEVPLRAAHPAASRR